MKLGQSLFQTTNRVLVEKAYLQTIDILHTCCQRLARFPILFILRNWIVIVDIKGQSPTYFLLITELNNNNILICSSTHSNRFNLRECFAIAPHCWPAQLRCLHPPGTLWRTLIMIKLPEIEKVIISLTVSVCIPSGRGGCLHQRTRMSKHQDSGEVGRDSKTWKTDNLSRLMCRCPLPCRRSAYISCS